MIKNYDISYYTLFTVTLFDLPIRPFNSYILNILYSRISTMGKDM